MKNCIPLLGIMLCLISLNNCTDRSDEKELDVQKTIKNENFTKKSNPDSIRPTQPTDPDPPKDGDDWINKP